MTTQCLHRTVKNALLAGLLGGFGAVHSHAQYTFNSGSTGADGALNVTSNTTLALPANGVFNYTTITVASGATLMFTPNALNTPVYLLATGDVTINGTIDVSGSAGTTLLGGFGGPGGFNGGNPATALPSSDGRGPGAGRSGVDGDTASGAGSGAYGGRGYKVYYNGYVSGLASTQCGYTYGSPLLTPLVGGSGGGGANANGGSGGGGAVLIASSSRVALAGSVVARGGASGGVSLGSGGAIRLVAPVIAGNGTLDVLGGNCALASYNYFGGAGRIRIDCIDRRTLALNCTPGVTSIGANMVSFLAPQPRLDITQVGTNTIAVGTGAPQFFLLPQDSPTNQTVTVQARNFGMVVPIRVVLTPENGPSSTYDTNIDNTITAASVTVPVVVPVNVQVQVNAWTR